MSTLINLVISLVLGILSYFPIKEPNIAQHEIKKNTTEIFLKLEARQHVLEC